MLTPLRSSTAKLDDGLVYYEHHVGDFVKSEGRVVTDIVFTKGDARAVAELLQCFSEASEVIIAFYPWLESGWESLSASGWTTMHEQTFVRHRWLGQAGSHRWVVGRARSPGKLVEIIHWAWTLPGRDTLLFIPTSDLDIRPLVRSFQDDEEDNDTNEIRLLRDYPALASRGLEGRYLRVFSTTVDDRALATCVGNTS